MCIEFYRSVVKNVYKLSWYIHISDRQSLYLVCERQVEVQHLATQLPFCLVLHVWHLNLDCNRSLKENKGQIKKINKWPWCNSYKIFIASECTQKSLLQHCTLFLRRNSSSGIRLSSVFIFLLEGSSSCGGGGWAGGMGAETVLGGWGTGGAGTNAEKQKQFINYNKIIINIFEGTLCIFFVQNWPKNTWKKYFFFLKIYWFVT